MSKLYETLPQTCFPVNLAKYWEAANGGAIKKVLKNIFSYRAPPLAASEYLGIPIL